MAGILRYLGLAEQSGMTQNPLPAATFYVDVDSDELDSPDDTQIAVPTGFGRSQRQTRPGMWLPNGDQVFYVDVRTIARVLRWALAGYAYTAAPTGGAPAAPTDFAKHEVWGNEENLLPLFTSRVGKDRFEHVFGGCVASSISIEVSNELVQVTISTNAATESRDTLRSMTFIAANLPAEYPLAFHEVTASIAGVDESAIVKSVTLSIDNNVDSEAGQTIGSRFTREHRAQDRSVTCDMDMRYNNTAQLERLWGSPNGPSVSRGSDTFDLILTFNSGQNFANAGHFGDLVIRLPKVYYTSVKQPVSGRDDLVQSVSAAALGTNVMLADGTTQVYSEILATIRNKEHRSLLTPMPALV